MSVVSNNILAGASGQGGAGDFAIERSLRFNSGDSSFLSRTPSAAGNQTTFTISTWVKRTKFGSYDPIFSADTSSTTELAFTTNNELQFVDGSSVKRKTNAVFRDPSAWYHIVLVWDTTNSTVADRCKIYVNGTEQSYGTAATISENETTDINTTDAHYINKQSNTYGNSYLANFQFIDGQALAATDFGETDDNGVWQPKEFAGSFTSYTGSYAVVTSHGNIDAGTLSNLFDGNTGTTFESGSTGGNIVFAPPGGLTYNTSVEVYTGRSTAQAVSLNGGSNVSTTSGWNTIASGSGTINNLTFFNGSAGNQAFSAIRVDGTILTTGSITAANSFHLDFKDNSSNAALGTDTSGNSNTWTVNNLTAAAAGLATANQGMDVVTYSGNSTARNIGGLAFTPDLVIVKARNSSYNHYWVDSVRGTNKNLYSNSTEATQTADRLSSFNSDGFGLTNHTGVNNSGTNYVAWCWKAGGSASSNTSGTITSQVSANTTYGFSIVKFTMGLSDVTIGHGLAVEPKFIITKRYSTTGNWITYHASLGKSKYLMLNSTAVAYTDTADAYTSTNSSVFDARAGLIDAGDCISYVWSEVAGFSKISSYTGNGSSTGPIVTTGFKPRFLVIKRTDSANNWAVFDSARSLNNDLKWNTSEAEGSAPIEFLSDGFQIKNTYSSTNTNGGTYAYMAFAAKPNQSAIDSLVDSPSQTATPTDTGIGNEVVGNYATWNPLTAASATYTQGNLLISSPSNDVFTTTQAVSSGKYYVEVEVMGAAGKIGIWNFDDISGDITGEFGWTDGGAGYMFDKDGNKYNNQSAASYGNTYTSGDIIGIALDMDNGKVFFSKNGTFQNSGVPASGSNPAFSGLSGTFAFAVGSSLSGDAYTLNAGQRAFAYTAPSGYKSLNTANLPEPTIADGSKYFDTKLYTGNQSVRSIPTSFSPDFVWIKDRTQAGHNHNLLDIVRGAPKILQSDTTAVEITDSTDGFTSFNSDGFSLGANVLGNQSYELNKTGNNYVAWAWDAGSSTVTNTDGSISAQVRANPSAGFSICTYTGTEGGTFGHGLNAAPEFVMVKRRNASAAWCLWHTSIPNTQYLMLNETNGTSTWNVWGNTSPTSSVVSVSGDSYTGNNGDTYVAYCFSSVAGYSAVGSYTNPSSSEGAFVHLGFKPAFLLIKCAVNISSSSSSGDWIIKDATRSPFNNPSDGNTLVANVSNAEDGHYSASQAAIDILSNGFKIRHPNSSPAGDTGRRYIYYAVAEHPFKNARAR